MHARAAHRDIFRAGDDEGGLPGVADDIVLNDNVAVVVEWRGRRVSLGSCAASNPDAGRERIDCVVAHGNVAHKARLQAVVLWCQLHSRACNTQGQLHPFTLVISLIDP